MTFADLQKEITGLVAKNEASVAPYLSCAKSLGTIQGEVPSYVRTIRTAFVSSFTIQGLAEVCQAQGIFHNLLAETYMAPYNQFSQEILAFKSGLYAFRPDVVYCMIDAPDVMDDAHLQSLVSTLLERTDARIVIFNFTEGKKIDRAAAGALNEGLGSLSSNNARVIIFDFASFLDSIGRSEYWYTKYTDMGDLRLAPSAFPALAKRMLAFAVAASGNTKKCVVLDLDNTLWRGIVGEDGPMGIVPDKKIQEYLVDLFEKGIILAINSKNNSEDALEAIESNPAMALKKKNFAAWRINWDSKEKNMAELAEELNLGTDSFVFVDDDPFQRELITDAFPEIAVLPPERLVGYGGFHSFVLTQEDKRRGVMYVEERMRKELQKSLRTEEDFLKELALRVEVSDVSQETIARISQLTQKTNQFNVTTRRYSEQDIQTCLAHGWKIWAISVADRFGDYGVVGVIMVEPKRNVWRVDNFLLSCRVLGRRVEDYLVEHLLKAARHEGVIKIEAMYISSAKNQQTKNFWDTMAFVLVSEDGKEKQYRYEFTS